MINKFHYYALTNSIVACTCFILGGQFWFAGNATVSFVFGAVGGIQVLLSIRNEIKADK